MADNVATITLNRPEARNALSRQVLRELPAKVQECDRRDDVRAVILTGADPAFCAGLDLKELGSNERRAAVDIDDPATNRRGPLPAISKPLIGAINGVAITGGFELALACDFLVASGPRPLRGHPHAGRHPAGLGPHRVAPRSRRHPPGARAEHDRQLPRRADRV